MKKVAWSAGHGRYTAGKRSPSDEREWTFNTKVVAAGMAYLSKYEGVQQLRLDDVSGNTDVPLSTRTNRANYWGADIYVSCHHNALGYGWGNHSGIETFVMTPRADNPKSLKLAKAVHPKVLKSMGLTDRGIKDVNFHELRETKMAAILVEGGFMDSRIDIKKMRDDNFLRAQGEAVAKGIAEYFGLKLKVTVKPTVKPVSKPKEEVMKLTEKAIVINSFIDYPAVQKLHIRTGYPIFERSAVKEKVARELIIAGGGIKGLEKFAERFIDLSGKSREETVKNVANYMNK